VPIEKTKAEPYMKAPIFSLSAIMLTMLLATSRGLPQNLFETSEANPSLVFSIEPPHTFSPSNSSASSAATGYVRLPPSGVPVSKPFRPFSRIGIASHTGLGGVGLDVATPLSKNFNIRAGSDLFNYSTSFQEQGANVAINLHMKSGHASVDWFPFGGRFRLSPQVVFANNNRILATALIPSGSTVTLNGQDYISSSADPLHGSGSVDFRKVSPGFTLGFGDIIPRTKSHFSVPVELGFYYVGQPGLKVNFSGSACDPTQPQSIGCESVNQDSGFQQNLAAFIARNNNNLSYASFFPIFSIGFGYSF
jgi:hypothetical protein